MKIQLPNLAKLGLLILLGCPTQSHAQVAVWNAYNDFYLSPTATGWGGDTTPSAAGAAWGYYVANVNGFGFPTNIGTYFTPTGAGIGSQNMYQYSNVAPIGTGTIVGTSGYANGSGEKFGYYGDTFSWGSSLGRYDTPWFGGAPGTSQGLTNLIWMQSGWLGGTNSVGIAPVLTWKAPTTGSYTITGLYVSGNQPANTASVAIVDSIGGSLLPTTGVANNTSQTFSFTQNYTAGDVVQFQTGNQFSGNNAVGWQVNIIPEPSSAALITAGLGALGLIRLRRRA